jgi:serine/threonine protein kinase
MNDAMSPLPEPEEDEQTVAQRRLKSPPPFHGREVSGNEQALPQVGECLFGFRVRGELGRGAFACVYLAQQMDLAGRTVVLKVSGIEGDEPQTLAQLQHTNIVPIYSVHESPHRNLRAVCMPYFGGATLSRVLDQLWRGPSSPTEGKELVEALLTVSDGLTPKGDEPQPLLDTEPPSHRLRHLEPLPYLRAVGRIMMQLAGAVAHAHDRRVLHHDIKPSNILLAGDGQPFLLDFNVARPPAAGHGEGVGRYIRLHGPGAPAGGC